jgi:hypothetical protein
MNADGKSRKRIGRKKTQKAQKETLKSHSFLRPLRFFVANLLSPPIRAHARNPRLNLFHLLSAPLAAASCQTLPFIRESAPRAGR